MSKYFDKIYSFGFQHLDHDKPTLIIANHPSAFTEPCLMTMLTKRPIHFLVRGDYFLWWNIWLFRFVQLVPIFRISETKDSTKRNRKTFEESNRNFHNNQVICIFAEGLSSEAKKMNTLKKGFARMAWSAHQDGVKDLQIHVLGTHFSNIQHPGGRAVLSCSEAIPFNQYEATFTENETLGYRKLHQDISNALQNIMVTIADMDETEARNRALNRHYLKYRSQSKTKWNRENVFAIKEIEESKLQEFNKHEDVHIPKKQFGILELLTIPLFLLIWPFYLVIDYLSKWTPLKAEFTSSMRIFYAVVVWPFYILILSILLYPLWPSPWIYFVVLIAMIIIFQVVSNVWTARPQSPFHPEKY